MRIRKLAAPVAVLVVLVAGAALAGTAGGQTAPSPFVAVEHMVVQRGDTWAKIARRAAPGITARQATNLEAKLRTANGNIALTSGLVVHVPLPLPAAAPTATTVPPTTAALREVVAADRAIGHLPPQQSLDGRRPRAEWAGGRQPDASRPQLPVRERQARHRDRRRRRCRGLRRVRVARDHGHHGQLTRQ